MIRNKLKLSPNIMNNQERFGIFRNHQPSLGIVKTIWNDLQEFDTLGSTKECTVAAPDCASRAFRFLTVQVFVDFHVQVIDFC